MRKSSWMVVANGLMRQWCDWLWLMLLRLGCVTDRVTATDTLTTTVAHSAARPETAINSTDRIWRANTQYFRRKWRHRTAAVPDSVERTRLVWWEGAGLLTSRRTRTMTGDDGIRAAAADSRPRRRRGRRTPSPTYRGPSTVGRGRGDRCLGPTTTPTTPTTTHTGAARVPRGDVDRLVRCPCRVWPATRTHVGIHHGNDVIVATRTHVGDSWRATSSRPRATKTATIQAPRPRRPMSRLWRHLSYRLNTKEFSRNRRVETHKS